MKLRKFAQLESFLRARETKRSVEIFDKLPRSETQRAMVAAKLANLGDGQRADHVASRSANLPTLIPTDHKPAPIPPVSQPAAAQMLNVSWKTGKFAG